MSESTMWNTVRSAFEGLDPVRVENRCDPGTPDVNFVEGWIELKWLPEAPVRGGIVHLDHFTPQQRAWIIRRAIRGGKVFVLLQLASTWLLFDGRWAAENLGRVNVSTLEENALGLWRTKLSKPELKQLVMR